MATRARATPRNRRTDGGAGSSGRTVPGRPRLSRRPARRLQQSDNTAKPPDGRPAGSATGHLFWRRPPPHPPAGKHPHGDARRAFARRETTFCSPRGSDERAEDRAGRGRGGHEAVPGRAAGTPGAPGRRGRGGRPGPGRGVPPGGTTTVSLRLTLLPWLEVAVDHAVLGGRFLRKNRKLPAARHRGWTLPMLFHPRPPPRTHKLQPFFNGFLLCEVLCLSPATIPPGPRPIPRRNFFALNNPIRRWFPGGDFRNHVPLNIAIQRGAAGAIVPP